MPRKPRRILPNVTYLITRRVRERAFRLRPEPWLRSLFAYAVGRAAKESGVEVIGFATMCNHYHAVVHDSDARVPEFTKSLDQLLGRAVNRKQGRKDALWAQGGPNYVSLLSREAVEEALVYSLLNPCAAGLVAGISAWPGFVTLPDMLGTESMVARPDICFFSKRSKLPLEVELRLTVPPTHAEMSAAEFRAHIAKMVKRSEDELRRDRRARGLLVLGQAKVLAFGLDQRPETLEPSRGPAPIAKAGQCAAAAALLDQHREAERDFQVRYRAAFEAFRAGEAVMFPHGTYRLRVDLNVPCQALA